MCYIMYNVHEFYQFPKLTMQQTIIPIAITTPIPPNVGQSHVDSSNGLSEGSVEGVGKGNAEDVACGDSVEDVSEDDG